MDGNNGLPRRWVEASELIPEYRRMMEDGLEVPLLVSGSSMSPFMIHQRDRILMRRIESPLRRGDMAMFQRDDGAYVMHRICRIRGDEYYFVGDAQTVIEGPVRRDQIFAVVTAVQRKGVWQKPGMFWWEFFRTVWLWMRPFRPLLVKLYGLAARKNV